MSRFGPAAAAIIALARTMPSVAADEQRPTEVSGGAQSSPLPNARTQDEDFLGTAPGLLYPEIEASKLGAEKARDPQVQALSRRMAEWNTELARKLEDAARSAELEFGT